VVVIVVVVVVVVVVTAVLVLVALEVEDELGDETEVEVDVVEGVGPLLAELVELKVTVVEGVKVEMTVCNMVVVETRVAVTVDIAEDEEEAIEEAKSDDDDANASVGVKMDVEAGGWPVRLTCVSVSVECVDQANVMARLEAISKNNGTHTRTAVTTKSGRPSNTLDIRPEALDPKCLILLRMTAR
jgi:hypothetical protein